MLNVYTSLTEFNESSRIEFGSIRGLAVEG